MSYTIPYANMEFAVAYFEERVNSDNWTNATEANRKAALATATRDIWLYARFPDGEQEGEFFKYPTDGSEGPEVPAKLKEACCEQALYKLAVNRLDIVEMTHMGVASAKGTVFDKGAIPQALCDECIDLLTSLGAEIEPGAGGSALSVVRYERLEK